jgi:hypothetical protein
MRPRPRRRRSLGQRVGASGRPLCRRFSTRHFTSNQARRAPRVRSTTRPTTRALSVDNIPSTLHAGHSIGSAALGKTNNLLQLPHATPPTHPLSCSRSWREFRPLFVLACARGWHLHPSTAPSPSPSQGIKTSREAPCALHNSKARFFQPSNGLLWPCPHPCACIPSGTYISTRVLSHGLNLLQRAQHIRLTSGYVGRQHVLFLFLFSRHSNSRHTHVTICSNTRATQNHARRGRSCGRFSCRARARTKLSRESGTAYAGCCWVSAGPAASLRPIAPLSTLGQPLVAHSLLSQRSVDEIASLTCPHALAGVRRHCRMHRRLWLTRRR